MKKPFPYPVSIAPMMEWTDRHYRFFMRQITKRTLLYTEMRHAEGVIQGDREMLLGFDPCEHPVALQLGGSDPERLALAAKIGEDWGYDEINLNVGCPSSRVQEGEFGACLMAKPDKVAEIIAKMQETVQVPVTVKHRIGIDNQNTYEELAHFVQTVAQTGCNRFTVHARIALLQGLNPKDNRTIPPLRYEDVYRLKQDFPTLWIEINGGIKNTEESVSHLKQVDAVMIGREAYNNPFFFSEVDALFYGEEAKSITRFEIIEKMIPYLEKKTSEGHPLGRITRHMMGLWRGQKGARQWRRLTNEFFRSFEAQKMVDVFFQWMKEEIEEDK